MTRPTIGATRRALIVQRARAGEDVQRIAQYQRKRINHSGRHGAPEVRVGQRSVPRRILSGGGGLTGLVEQQQSTHDFLEQVRGHVGQRLKGPLRHKILSVGQERKKETNRVDGGWCKGSGWESGSFFVTAGGAIISVEMEQAALDPHSTQQSFNSPQLRMERTGLQNYFAV